MADPCESRRYTAKEWTRQTIYRRPDDQDQVAAEVQDISEAFAVALDEAAGAFEEPPSDDEPGEETACNLVHPAGFGAVDTGCGCGVVGEETLVKHEQALKRHGLHVEELESKPHRFR